MKFGTQRIIRCAIALMLVVCTMFSLSSCLFAFDFYSDLLENNQEDDKNGDFNIFPDFGGSGNDQGGSSIITPGSPNQGQLYPGSGEEDVENVSALQKTLLSTVIVHAEFFNSSVGSGVIVSIDKESGDAYIVTNYHVIYNETYGVSGNINIYLYGMELSTYAIPATFVGGSVTFDIAVLRVEANEILKKSYANAATFASSDSICVFDTVYAVGNPEGYGISASRGIVSVTSEDLDIEGADGSEVSLRVIRFDAGVNSGNSGGGLYNSNGGLVGIVCAKRVGSNVDNMSYAIPSDLVNALVKNILDYCEGTEKTQVHRALMGVTITAYVTGVVIDPETGDIHQAELVEVMEISQGALAYGVMKVGDIINSITVDGVTTTVSRLHHVTDSMLYARVGSKVSLSITRDGKDMTVDFDITESCITAVK